MSSEEKHIPNVSDIEISGIEQQFTGNVGNIMGKDPLLKAALGNESDLKNAEYCLISQRVEWCEYLPLIEVANQYTVYQCEKNFEENPQQMKEIGKFEERKGNIDCLCVCKQNREFVNEFIVGGKELCTGIRPYKCNTNWLSMVDVCRPEIEIRENDKKIGLIEWPCWCLLWPPRGLLSCQEFNIKDEKDNIIYTITSPCLQMGYLCWCFGWLDCCTKRIVLREDSKFKDEDKAALCSKRGYFIKDHEGNQVGEIWNIYNGVCLEMFTRADKYGIHFPPQCSVKHKLILLQAVILLDYLMYGG